LAEKQEKSRNERSFEPVEIWRRKICFFLSPFRFQMGSLYRAYGLTVESDLELPELPASSSGSTALTILERRVDFEAPDTSKVICRATGKGELVVYSKGVGTALVRNGSEILIQPGAGVDPLTLRLFLLQQVMAMALWQRGLLVLHAGAVVIDGKAAAFVGASGQGKSTLVAALGRLGCPVLCDDVLAIEMGSGALMAQVGLTHLKLTEQARENVGVGTDAQTIPDRSNKKLCAMDGKATEAAPLGAIFLLATGERVELLKVATARAVIELVRQSYGAELLPHLGKAGNHFEQCAEIARTIPMYVLSRPRDFSLLPKIAEEVIQRVRQPLL
jgi:hypothetical protein